MKHPYLLLLMLLLPCVNARPYIIITENINGNGNGTQGPPGQNGLNGTDGVGIANVGVLANGSLNISYTNGTIRFVGNTTGAKGDTGATGATGPTGPQGPAGTNGTDGTNATANFTISGDVGTSQTVGNAQTLTFLGYNCILSTIQGTRTVNVSVNYTCLDDTFYLLSNPLGFFNRTTDPYIGNLSTICMTNGTNCPTDTNSGGNMSFFNFYAGSADKYIVGNNTNLKLLPGSGLNITIDATGNVTLAVDSTVCRANGTGCLISNNVTGTGTINKLAYWENTSKLAETSSLTLTGKNLELAGNLTINTPNGTLNITRLNGNQTSPFYVDSKGDVHIGVRNPSGASPNCNSDGYKFILDGDYLGSDRSSYIQNSPVNECANGENQMCFFANDQKKFCIGPPGAIVFNDGIQLGASSSFLISGTTMRTTNGVPGTFRGEFNTLTFQGEKHTAGDYDLKMIGKNPSGGRTASNIVGFFQDSTVVGYVTPGGGLVMNEEGNATGDVRFEGDTDPYLFFTNATTDRVGIGTNSPSQKLDVTGSISASLNMYAGGNITPLVNNSMWIGTSTNKVAQLYAVNVSTGDLNFKNGMKMSEPDNATVCIYGTTGTMLMCMGPLGMQFYNSTGSVVGVMNDSGLNVIGSSGLLMQGPSVLTNLTPPIGGSLLSALSATYTNVTVAGARPGMIAGIATNASNPSMPPGLVQLDAWVVANNTVTVRQTALVLITPPSTVYSISVYSR